MRFACIVPVVILGACVQPQETNLPPPPSAGEQCPLFERDPMKEPDLMAWDVTQRQKVHEKRSQGVVAVQMMQSGCDVTARVVDCVGTVEGADAEPYEFKWYYSSDTVVADTQQEAYSKLPLGATSLGGEIGAGKSLRVDYVMAGSYVMPDALSVSGWVGSECADATHFVKRIVVGGFASASGQRDEVHGDVGLFGVGVGAGEQRSRLHWRTEGSASACKQAEQKRDVSAGCDMPLRLELKPIPDRAVSQDPGGADQVQDHSAKPEGGGGEPTVQGHLAPEVIQRVVRQGHRRFRLCYENGLKKDPSLKGRVSVSFFIGRDGSVSNVSDAGSDLPDPEVVACVISSYYGLLFPQPEGGIVRVVYPLGFSPGH